jgi:hypothetical protein
MQERVQTVLDAAAAKGIGVAFVTLTGAHNRHTRLAHERRDFSKSFAAIQKGTPWKRKRKAGLIGMVPIWEPTDGENGWHLHAHALVLHSGGTDAAVAAGEWLVPRWQSALRTRGWRTARVAQDVRPITSVAGLPDYGAKAMTGWGAAAELAKGWHKEGKRPDRLTLPQLLGLAVAGDARAADRYAEAVTALSGKRLLVVGPTVAKALGIAPVTLKDGDAVEPEKRLSEVLGMIRAEIWNRLGRRYLRAWAVGTVGRLTAQGTPWEDVAARLTERAFQPGEEPPGQRLDRGGDRYTPPSAGCPPDARQTPGPCSARAGGEDETNRDGPRPDASPGSRRRAEVKMASQGPGRVSGWVEAVLTGESAVAPLAPVSGPPRRPVAPPRPPPPD